MHRLMMIIFHPVENMEKLVINHIDGNKSNNNLENLELRCPNCHYFTDTYKSKNRSSCKSESDN